MIKQIFITITMIFLIGNLIGQNQLQIDHSASTMSILGTSTLHDWEIKVHEFDGTMKASSSLTDIMDGKLTAMVESFRSHKKSMDKVVFDAMMKDKYPTLTFQYGGTAKTFSKNGKSYRVISGKLTVAGTTRDIAITMQVQDTGNSIQLKGKKTFKMSDFNIDPPTAVFGTIRSGDEITIDFNIKFS